MHVLGKTKKKWKGQSVVFWKNISEEQAEPELMQLALNIQEIKSSKKQIKNHMLKVNHLYMGWLILSNGYRTPT